MKKALMILVFLTAAVSGQYRDSGFPTSTVKDGIVNNSGTSLFGLNLNDFRMNHSFSLSYSAFGNSGIAMGVYTNSMFYDVADNLNLQADVSIVNSPYSSLGSEFQKSINGIYLSRAAVNYRPWKDFYINLQYRSIPMLYGPGYYDSYYNRFNTFERDPFWGF